jgi:hypothetical protein
MRIYLFFHQAGGLFRSEELPVRKCRGTEGFLGELIDGIYMGQCCVTSVQQGSIPMSNLPGGRYP